jgi:hypothetical protein
MFKNRTLTIRMEKRNKTETTDNPEADHFEKKADTMLHRLEKTGIKVFAGICIFVLLDTYRQVKVAEASNPDS